MSTVISSSSSSSSALTASEMNPGEEIESGEKSGESSETPVTSTEMDEFLQGPLVTWVSQPQYTETRVNGPAQRKGMKSF